MAGAAATGSGPSGGDSDSGRPSGCAAVADTAAQPPLRLGQVGRAAAVAAADSAVEQASATSQCTVAQSETVRANAE